MKWTILFAMLLLCAASAHAGIIFYDNAETGVPSDHGWIGDTAHFGYFNNSDFGVHPGEGNLSLVVNSDQAGTSKFAQMNSTNLTNMTYPFTLSLEANQFGGGSPSQLIELGNTTNVSSANVDLAGWSYQGSSGFWQWTDDGFSTFTNGIPAGSQTTVILQVTFANSSWVTVSETNLSANGSALSTTVIKNGTTGKNFTPANTQLTILALAGGFQYLAIDNVTVSVVSSFANSTNISFISPTDGTGVENRSYVKWQVNVTGNGIDVSNSTVNVTLFNASQKFVADAGQSQNSIFFDSNVVSGSAGLGSASGTNFYTVDGNFSSIPDGVYYLNATLTYNGQITSTETRNYTIDTIAPNIGFAAVTEANGSTSSNAYIQVAANAADANLANITISLYDGSRAILSNVTLSIGGPNQTLQANFTGLANGNYYFNATATDVLGHTSSTSTYIVTLGSCTPHYSCASYDVCASGVQHCLAVTDNACGTQYNGSISLYDITCAQTQSGGSPTPSTTASAGSIDAQIATLQAALATATPAQAALIQAQIAALQQQKASLQGVTNAGAPGAPGAPKDLVKVVSADNTTLFTVQTDTGATSSELLMYPGQTRTLTYVIASYTQSSQDLTVSCTGGFCSNVQLSKTQVSLPGMATQIVTATVSMPLNVLYGSTSDFSISIADSGGHTAVLPTEISVNKLSLWYSKYALVTQPGDAGFWFSVAGMNVPKLFLYVGLVVLLEIVLSLLLPEGKKYAVLRTVLYVGGGVGVFVLISLIY